MMRERSGNANVPISPIEVANSLFPRAMELIPSEVKESLSMEIKSFLEAHVKFN